MNTTSNNFIYDVQFKRIVEIKYFVLTKIGFSIIFISLFLLFLGWISTLWIIIFGTLSFLIAYNRFFDVVYKKKNQIWLIVKIHKMIEESRKRRKDMQW